jgi:hypothetical protein
MGHKLLHFVSIFNSQPCLIPLSEQELSEPEPHRITAPAPTKRCGSFGLQLRNTDKKAELSGQISGAYMSILDEVLR